MQRDEQAAVQAVRPEHPAQLDPVPGRDAGRRRDLVRSFARCHGSILVFPVGLALFVLVVLAVAGDVEIPAFGADGEQGADRLRGLAAAADDAADVVGREPELDHAIVGGVDLDLFGLLGQRCAR